ncbi:MAG: hypothetical protein E6772_07935 [Dysgonomonas sp.]|nr:hypothetical protein [Dysgonomonas sp.]
MYNREEQLQENFINLLKEKVPNKLAETLTEILPLEKEAIYRRLRGNVSFSFNEISLLASHFGISLDNLAKIASPYRTKWYQLHVRDYSQFNEIDLNMSHSYIKAIDMAADSSYSEFGIAANMLPLHISLLHPPLYRVYLLKWLYQFGRAAKDKLRYSEVQVPREEVKTYQLYLKAVERIKYTFFIWDSSFLISLINDINFFYKISIINLEEILMLKQEIIGLLDTIRYYADYGKFDSTGNKVEVYISILNFDTSYSYLLGDNISISMSSAYSLGAFTSQEKDSCEEMKQWIMGLKKSSVLISGASEREKIRFFNEQREILEKRLIIEEDDL